MKNVPKFSGRPLHAWILCLVLAFSPSATGGVTFQKSDYIRIKGSEHLKVALSGDSIILADPKSNEVQVLGISGLIRGRFELRGPRPMAFVAAADEKGTVAFVVYRGDGRFLEIFRCEVASGSCDNPPYEEVALPPADGECAFPPKLHYLEETDEFVVFDECTNGSGRTIIGLGVSPWSNGVPRPFHLMLPERATLVDGILPLSKSRFVLYEPLSGHIQVIEEGRVKARYKGVALEGTDSGGKAFRLQGLPLAVSRVGNSIFVCSVDVPSQFQLNLLDTFGGQSSGAGRRKERDRLADALGISADMVYLDTVLMEFDLGLRPVGFYRLPTKLSLGSLLEIGHWTQRSSDGITAVVGELLHSFSFPLMSSEVILFRMNLPLSERIDIVDYRTMDISDYIAETRTKTDFY
ncbi:MAG: hypothetical protein ACREJQ_03510 [bacterium]